MTHDTAFHRQPADGDIRVLFLHGSGSNGSSRKAGILRGHFRTESPDLPFPGGRLISFVSWVFDRASRQAARRIAQSFVDSFQPHVLCGSSMGSALAATLESDAALVLVAPAFGLFTRFRAPRVLPARTIILHARNDALVSQTRSRMLLESHRGCSAREQADIDRIRSGLAALGYDQSCPRSSASATVTDAMSLTAQTRGTGIAIRMPPSSRRFGFSPDSMADMQGECISRGSGGEAAEDKTAISHDKTHAGESPSSGSSTPPPLPRRGLSRPSATSVVLIRV